MKSFLLFVLLVPALVALPARAACEGARVVLLPFDAVALPRAEARQTEDAVRRAVARTPGVCLETRARTVEKLRALGGRLSVCEDAACRGTQVASLDTDWVVHGRALGLGGGRTVSLALRGRDGSETRRTFPVTATDAEEPALKAFGELWAPHNPERTAGTWKHNLLPKVLAGAGVAALAAGVGFGLAARSTERGLSSGNGGCTGEGEAFRQCFANQLQTGQSRARAANVFAATGVVLGAGAAVLFIWELP